MKRFILSMLIVFVIPAQAWFWENEFDGSYQSIEKMMRNLPINEQVNFIKEMELVVFVKGGEYKLKGWTAKEIRNEALKIIQFTKKKNIKFLKKFISEMKEKNQKSTYLHISKYGMMSEPKPGIYYKKTYSLAQLEQLLANLQ